MAILTSFGKLNHASPSVGILTAFLVALTITFSLFYLDVSGTLRMEFPASIPPSEPRSPLPIHFPTSIPPPETLSPLPIHLPTSIPPPETLSPLPIHIPASIPPPEPLSPLPIHFPTSIPPPKPPSPPIFTSFHNCDLLDGKWIHDDAYPLYTSQSCSLMDGGFRCLENGRKDASYTKLRWQPNHCDLPRFNATKLLELIRNRRFAFVGDSVGRNQWESLLCMLASSVKNKSSIYEAHGEAITKHKGFLVFVFEEYNCTVEYYRSPFLMFTGHAPPAAPKSVKSTLRLDLVDSTSKLWKNADFLVFNTGHWWTYDKTVKWACYFQEKDEIKTEMTIETAYRKALGTLMDWVRENIDQSKTQIYFRTYAPSHYMNGEWNTNGGCYHINEPRFGQREHVSEFYYKTLIEALARHDSGADINILNVTGMSMDRCDGHPSIYYWEPKVGPAPLSRQDCSHWCLPGVPDAWNEILYALLLRNSNSSIKDIRSMYKSK